MAILQQNSREPRACQCNKGRAIATPCGSDTQSAGKGLCATCGAGWRRPHHLFPLPTHRIAALPVNDPLGKGDGMGWKSAGRSNPGSVASSVARLEHAQQALGSLSSISSFVTCYRLATHTAQRRNLLLTESSGATHFTQRRQPTLQWSLRHAANVTPRASHCHAWLAGAFILPFRHHYEGLRR